MKEREWKKRGGVNGGWREREGGREGKAEEKDTRISIAYSP